MPQLDIYNTQTAIALLR